MGQGWGRENGLLQSLFPNLNFIGGGGGKKRTVETTEKGL